MDGLFLECSAERIGVWNLLKDTAKPPQSVTKTVQTIVSVWHPTGRASSPSGVFPGPRGGEVDVSLALSRWCAMRNQEPAPSGP